MGIKIRIRDEAHCREVQDALFKAGYSWFSASKEYHFEYAVALYAEGKSLTYMAHNNGDYFEHHDNVEKFLVDGELVDKDVELVKPPLGLRPRYIVDAIRIQEILAACTRYTTEAKPIPAVWLEELSELNARVK